MEWIMTFFIFFTLLIALGFTGSKEGWRERERQVMNHERERKWASIRWHCDGWAQRAFIVLASVAPFYIHWQIGLLALGISLWFAWVFYDALTNLPKDLSSVFPTKPTFYQRFFYSGSTKTGTGSWWDIHTKGRMPLFKKIYTLITIPIVVLFIYCLTNIL